MAGVVHLSTRCSLRTILASRCHRGTTCATHALFLRQAAEYCVEFNPNRPSARVRYSIAHEIAHTLFPDCGERVRHRAFHSELQGDEWQLEAICNVGAAELLMPLGSLKSAKDSDWTIESLLALRQQYEVSMEALLIRIVRLTEGSRRNVLRGQNRSGRGRGAFPAELHDWVAIMAR